MYIKVNNDAPENYSIGQLRRDNPQTSFPKQISEEMLAEYDVYATTTAKPPEVLSTQKLNQSTKPVLVDGAWVYQWTVVEKTADEIAEYNANQATAMREKRNTLLSNTDFYALSDVTMTDTMATYRQALRDITKHSAFPDLSDDDWPTAP
jgi:hypothetical protein